jgi:hypothetical protein
MQRMLHPAAAAQDGRLGEVGWHFPSLFSDGGKGSWRPRALAMVLRANRSANHGFTNFSLTLYNQYHSSSESSPTPPADIKYLCWFQIAADDQSPRKCCEFATFGELPSDHSFARFSLFVLSIVSCLLLDRFAQ